MRRIHIFLPLVLFSAIILGLAGCRLLNPADSENGVVPTTPQQGAANVAVRFVVPGPGNSSSVSNSIRLSDTVTTQVECRLWLANPGNRNNPFTLLTRLVDVTGGTAEVGFSGLTVSPVLIQIRIVNGNHQGWSDFHGAQDLVTGNNTVDVVPPGCRLPQDIIANALQAILQVADLMEVAPQNMVATIQKGVPADLTASDSYLVAEEKFIISVRPATFFRFAIQDGQLACQDGTGTEVWKQTATQLLGTGKETFVPLAVLRQPFGTGSFGFVLWRSADGTEQLLSRVSVANPPVVSGTFSLTGAIRSLLVWNDGNIFIGGSHQMGTTNYPFVCKWSGTTQAGIDGAGSPSNLVWLRPFTAQTSNSPKPVDSLVFNGVDKITANVFCSAITAFVPIRLLVSDGTPQDNFPTSKPNIPPIIEIIQPASGTHFNIGQPIDIVASAADLDGNVWQVSFYRGSILLIDDPDAPFSFTWNNAPDGKHILKAVAVDDKSGRGYSLEIPVTVGTGNPAPQIVSQNPLRDAPNVALNATVVLNFDVAMDHLSFAGANFSVKQTSDNTPVTGTMVWSNATSTLTFTPDQQLKPATNYTVTVSSNVTNAAGTPLGTNVSWGFTTVSTQLAVQSKSPDANATDVKVTASVTVTFGEVLDQSSFSTTKFALTANQTAVDVVLTFSDDGKTAILTPRAALGSDTLYSVFLSGQVKGTSGSVLGTDQTWTFRTAPYPVLVNWTPVTNVTLAPLNSKVVLTFTTEMDPSTFNDNTFTLKVGETQVQGTIMFDDAKRVMTFTPNQSLSYNTTYVAFVSQTVKNYGAVPLPTSHTWNFTTIAEPGVNTDDLRVSEVSTSENGVCWIEIYNGTSVTKNLSDYQMNAYSLPSTGGTFENKTYNLPSLSIPAKSYALLVANSNARILSGPGLAVIKTGDGYIPQWYEGSGFVELLLNGQTVDFVRFGSSSQEPSTNGTWNGGSAPTLPFGSNDVLNKSLARNQALDDSNWGTDWTVKQFATPGGPNDVDTDADNDGDGIPDANEASGKTFIGLPLYDWGARPNQTDVFMHICHMDASPVAEANKPGMIPTEAALDKVAAAFAPHSKPNLIKMHFDVGTLIQKYNLDNKSHQISYSEFIYLGNAPSNQQDLYYLKSQHLPLAKRQIFYFCIFGCKDNSGATGMGEVDGNDFYLALGGTDYSNTDLTKRANYITNSQASTLMHEFGHNLGLHHGGGDETNYKPSYRSIMNYLYSGLGLPPLNHEREGDRYYHKKFEADNFDWTTSIWGQTYFNGEGTTWDQLENGPYSSTFILDFSSGSGTGLNEASISETEGIGYSPTMGVDYNGNGNRTDTLPNTDVNFSGTVDGSLGDYNDWQAINLVFSKKSQGASNRLRTGRRPGTPVFAVDDYQQVADETGFFFKEGKR